MSERPRNFRMMLSSEDLMDDVEVFVQLAAHYENRGDLITARAMERAVVVYSDLARAGGLILSKEVGP